MLSSQLASTRHLESSLRSLISLHLRHFSLTFLPSKHLPVYWTSLLIAATLLRQFIAPHRRNDSAICLRSALPRTISRGLAPHTATINLLSSTFSMDTQLLPLRSYLTLFLAPTQIPGFHPSVPTSAQPTKSHPGRTRPTNRPASKATILDPSPLGWANDNGHSPRQAGSETNASRPSSQRFRLSAPSEWSRHPLPSHQERAPSSALILPLEWSSYQRQHWSSAQRDCRR